MSENMNNPLISCLCVTRGIPEFVARAVRNFERQDYPNKELVFVTETPNALTCAPDYAIKHYLDAKDGHIPVGKQRNASVQQASGEFVAVWDDDDFFSPERLSYSLARMLATNKAAFALQHESLLISNKLYHSTRRIWENSFLTRKEYLLKVPYPEVQIGEDLHMVRLFRRRYGDRSICLDSNYQLYVYVQQPTGTTYADPSIWQRNAKKPIPEKESSDILAHCGVT